MPTQAYFNSAAIKKDSTEATEINARADEIRVGDRLYFEGGWRKVITTHYVPLFGRMVLITFKRDGEVQRYIFDVSDPVTIRRLLSKITKH